MKKILLMIPFLFPVFAGAQNEGVCYNSGMSASKNLSIETNVYRNQLSDTSLILMPYVMNEKSVITMMKQKNNSSINKFLRRIKLSRDFETISIAAIPETLLGATFLGIASSTGDNTQSGRQKQIAVGLLAASGVCLTSSLCFKIIHKKNYKKAIRKYNQLYN
jgi:hypothetical protein